MAYEIAYIISLNGKIDGKEARRKHKHEIEKTIVIPLSMFARSSNMIVNFD